MREDSPLWRVMGDPAQAQEAAALAKVKELLPDDGPFQKAIIEGATNAY